SPAGEAYKVLRTRVLQRMTANAWSSIAVTSPTMGNGKTVTAVNLAISLAREVNHTVLLVDFDLKRPNVHNFFTDEPALGISDYFSRDVPLAEILFNPGIDRLVVLPGNEAMEGSSEVLLAPKMRTLVDDLKSRYPNRIVIFDLPPALFFDDVLAFSPYIDAVLMVAEEGVTTKQQLQQACRMIDAERLCGVVLNKSQVPRPEMNMQYGYGVR
ncbi:MAG: AAA family ATPase, partial [Chloroflexota bacterium]|nr:AAA family ATPase [Chloroflexota bacterium]